MTIAVYEAHLAQAMMINALLTGTYNTEMHTKYLADTDRRKLEVYKRFQSLLPPNPMLED